MDVRWNEERRSWTFADFRAPMLMNHIRGMDKFKYARLIEEYQNDIGWAVRTGRVKPIDKCRIIVRHTYRQHQPDTLACAPAVKAMVDGLVKMGILIDDRPQFVTDIKFVPPSKGVDCLEIEVIPIEKMSAQ